MVDQTDSISPRLVATSLLADHTAAWLAIVWLAIGMILTSVCLSLCLWHCAFWLNSTSYGKTKTVVVAAATITIVKYWTQCAVCTSMYPHLAIFQFCCSAKFYNRMYNTDTCLEFHGQGDGLSASVWLAAVLDWSTEQQNSGRFMQRSCWVGHVRVLTPLFGEMWSCRPVIVAIARTIHDHALTDIAVWVVCSIH